MIQDKTLREQLTENYKKGGLIVCGVEEMERFITNFYEDKIKSVVREMRGKYLYLDDHEVGSARHSGYEEALDDLLERLGIK